MTALALPLLSFGDGNAVAVGATLENDCQVFTVDEHWTGQPIPGEGFVD